MNDYRIKEGDKVRILPVTFCPDPQPRQAKHWNGRIATVLRVERQGDVRAWIHVNVDGTLLMFDDREVELCTA